MTFETKVREALASLLADQNSQIVIDSISPLAAEVLSVRFHLEGAWASPAGFTFPFAESVPLDDSLAALKDVVTRSWRTAHLPPRMSTGQAATSL